MTEGGTERMESAAVYQALGEAIDFGIWVCDADGRNTFASDCFLRLLGISQEECSGFRWIEKLHPDDREATLAAWEHCSKTGDFWEREHRFLGVDGKWHPILARGVPIRDSDGKIFRWAGINLDISGYKDAEAALNARSQALGILHRLGLAVAGELNVQAVAQAATDAAREVSQAAFGAFFYNTVDDPGEARVPDALSGASLEAFEMFGIPGRTELFGPISRGEGIVRIGDVIKDPRHGRMGLHHGMPTGELPVRSYLAAPVVSRRGTVHGGLFLGHPEPDVFDDEAERLVSAITSQAAIAMDNAVLHDTSLKSSEQLRLAIAASQLGDWSWDAVSDVVDMSDLAASHFGIEPGPRMTWTEMRQLLHPDDRERTRLAVEVAAEHRTDYHSEYRVIRPDGRTVWIAAWGRGKYDGDGTMQRMLGVVQDITSRKTAEAALREAKEAAETANRSKDKFLAVLSHELRTPLTPVLMAAAALESDPSLPEKLRGDMRMIRRNVELETKIIDDLLDLSRITTGKLKLRTAVVDLNKSVREVCEMCAPQLQEKGVRLQADYAEGPCAVVADSSRLQQVLWNVLKNAVKFVADGGNICVRTEIAGAQVRVTIADDGKGIDADVLPRIFDAFEQGSDAVTQQFGGLGLGLAISRAVMELHNGTISAESDGPGKGSKFTMEFPCAIVDRETPRGPEMEQNALRRPLRLLIVEDHIDTALMLERLLAARGYEVRRSDSAEAALRLAESEGFDIVISDIGLPDMPGHDLMRRLRNRHPVRGIAMSGFGMEEDVRRSLDAGFSEHLVKPVNLTLLETAINRVARSPHTA